jgi:hypothetical protein
MVKMIKWDIIFLVYKFPGIDIKFETGDQILEDMRDFYRCLSKHAKEVVFIPSIQIQIPFSPLEKAMHRLRVGKPISDVLIERNVSTKFKPLISNI